MFFRDLPFNRLNFYDIFSRKRIDFSFKKFCEVLLGLIDIVYEFHNSADYDEIHVTQYAICRL